MKIDPFCCCLLLSTCCWGQNIVGNPSGSQTIVQPTGTEFNVNRFEATRYADQFPGSEYPEPRSTTPMQIALLQAGAESGFQQEPTLTRHPSA